MREIPILETARLRLRAHTSRDFSFSCDLWAHPEVVKFIGGKPFTRQQTWARILNYHGLWSVLGFGYWLIEDKSTHSPIGEVGLADFKRELTPSIENLPEAGWVLHPSYHGQGLASEALREVLIWADRELGREKMACVISPENVKSIRLAEQVGFADAAQSNYLGASILIFYRTRPNL